MPKIFVRLLIFLYIHQSCKVRWNKSYSESFSVVNGVRQGAVLSPSLFSLYIDKLLLNLKASGFGCNIGNHFYGASAYADDIILLSPTRSGLQEMFTLCYDYFNEHDIIISTNPDPAKSKTKCIYFPYGRQDEQPIPILMGDSKLPWVDHWPHLGNNINRNDFRYPGTGSLSHDLMDKRGIFIGKFHSLLQEFGFADSSVMMRMVHIYATSFYGSQLWDYSSSDANRLFASWNMLVRKVHNVPNTTHRYLIESLSDSKHLKAVLFKRYLSFVHSLTNSRKDCLSSLGNQMIKDHGSVTNQNLLLIARESNTENVLGMSPNDVANQIEFAPTPPGEEWRSNFLMELLDLRKHNLELCWEDDVDLSFDELNDLIRFVATT